MSKRSSSNDNRKRKRAPTTSSWKDLPKFLDASASVSASTFGARRLPELQRLYNQCYNNQPITTTTATLPDQAFQSGGCKTSSRHLRRRTTAIQTRTKFHRYPRANNNNKNASTDNKTETTATATAPETKSTVRKARRGRRSSLCQSHYSWHQPQADDAKEDYNEEKAEGEKAPKADSCHWTMTHLWHAKRFHMETLWNWRIPLCHTNRGARAMFRWETEGKCALQDITWKQAGQPITLSFTSNQKNDDYDNDGTLPPPLAILIQTCRRICPNFGESKGTLCGSQMGNGVLYQLDQFPCQAIGPAWWMIESTSSSGDDDSSRRATKWTVHWMVHPSTRPALLECLENLLASATTATKSGEFSLDQSSSKQPKSCFRLSGSAATKILCHTNLFRKDGSASKESSQHQWDWNILQHLDLKKKKHDDADKDLLLLHGAMIRVALSAAALENSTQCGKYARNADVSEDEIRGKSMDAVHQHINAVQEAIESCDPTNKSVREKPNNEHEEEEALLVWRCPRALDCAPNRAVSGWDVYVPAKHAKKVWMALEMGGSCCAIGMVDESHLYLECSPPLPVFPRDYVDTEQSILYWNGGDGDSGKRGKNTDSWRLVRRLFEGGWGRLPIKQDRKLQSIAWNDLVATSTNSNNDNDDSAANDNEIAATHLAIVRGAAIGQPFVNVVTGCGHLPETFGDNTTSKRRRKRRRVRPPNETFRANPLSHTAAEQFRQVCANLQSSLSLPAVLVCHVRCFGKRNICVGNKLYHSEQYLGRVTAGSFSLARGICHGVAIVGAARLLNVLQQGAGSGGGKPLSSGCIVRGLNGRRQVHLAVTAENANCIQFEASLCLIL